MREIAITRTGILCEAPYEIVAHKRIGKGVGVTDEQNEALENWQSATCFNEMQRAALAFTDEIVKLHKPTDATFNAICVETDAGRAGRAAALGRLLHHDVEISGNVCHRHAAGDGSGCLVAPGKKRIASLTQCCVGQENQRRCWRQAHRRSARQRGRHKKINHFYSVTKVDFRGDLL